MFLPEVGWRSHPPGTFPAPYAVSEALTRYMAYLLSKKNLKPATVKRKTKMIKSLLKHGCDLADAENVVRFLNVCSLACGTRGIAIDSCRDYLDMLALATILRVR